MIWKITNFKAKMQEAKQIPDWELKSRPFYTSRYGYKLAVSVFLNGNGSGEGKFMSVYIKVGYTPKKGRFLMISRLPRTPIQKIYSEYSKPLHI